jgi:hypothetical protein
MKIRDLFEGFDLRAFFRLFAESSSTHPMDYGMPYVPPHGFRDDNPEQKNKTKPLVP